MENDMIVDAQR